MNRRGRQGLARYHLTDSVSPLVAAAVALNVDNSTLLTGELTQPVGPRGDSEREVKREPTLETARRAVNPQDFAARQDGRARCPA